MPNIVPLNDRGFAVMWNEAKVACLEKAATMTSINNNTEFDEVGAVQTAISKLIKRLETERKVVTAPLDEEKKLIMAEEKRLAQPLNAELTRLKGLTSAYATAVARRIEEERRAAELAERRAAEAAVAAEDADPFGFNDATEVVAQPQVMVSTMPTTTHNRLVERWDFEILDANAVSRELCSPDEKKIRAYIASRKAEGYKADQVLVKGLKIISAVQVQSR